MPKHAVHKKKAARRRRLVAVSAALLAVALVFAGARFVKYAYTLLTRPADTNGPTTPTTTVTPGETTDTTTTTTTQPTAVYVDGHYVQTVVPDWSLRLVNPWNPLPAEYDYEASLVAYDSSRSFDQRAVESLQAMLSAGGEYGLRAASLYRSYDHQQNLFVKETNEWLNAGYAKADAEAKAATEVARPGTSEHHVGLAADILGSGYQSLEQSFENTAAFAWLKAHCAQYGFILRYPADKQEITGVIYEPWHYRYVGVEAATEMMSRGLTLEEYLAEYYP